MQLFKSVFKITHKRYSEVLRRIQPYLWKDHRSDHTIKQIFPEHKGAHERLAPGKTYSSSQEITKEGWRFVKAIATTEETRFDLLQQGPVGTPHFERSSGRDSSGLGQLLAHAMSGRATLGDHDREDAVEMWTTVQVEV